MTGNLTNERKARDFSKLVERREAIKLYLAHKLATVGGIKMVTFPSHPIPFKWKRSVQQKTGTKREEEQATNGATNYANRTLALTTRQRSPRKLKGVLLQSIC